jgi:hypothetical protein
MQLKLDATTILITTCKRLNLISIIDGGKSMAFVIVFCSSLMLYIHGFMLYV